MFLYNSSEILSCRVFFLKFIYNSKVSDSLTSLIWKGINLATTTASHYQYICMRTLFLKQWLEINQHFKDSPVYFQNEILWNNYFSCIFVEFQ